MSPLTWLKLVPVVIEGASAAIAAFRGKDDHYRTQERIDAIRARGAAHRRMRGTGDPQADIDTKRAKPPL